jgi:hypothetical protein
MEGAAGQRNSETMGTSEGAPENGGDADVRSPQPDNAPVAEIADDGAKPVGAKEIIGLKKMLKEKGMTDEELVKVLPAVRTRSDYLRVVAEHGIAA